MSPIRCFPWKNDSLPPDRHRVLLFAYGGFLAPIRFLGLPIHPDKFKRRRLFVTFDTSSICNPSPCSPSSAATTPRHDVSGPASHQLHRTILRHRAKCCFASLATSFAPHILSRILWAWCGCRRPSLHDPPLANLLRRGYHARRFEVLRNGAQPPPLASILL